MANNEDIYDVLRRILTKATNPVILTDTAWQPILWNNLYFRSPESGKKILLPEKLTDEQRRFLDQKIASLRKSFKPRPIYSNLNRDHLLAYLVYGNSMLIRGLFVMPFMEIGLGAAFVALLYLAFHNIRVTERSNLWVGLAKETAHQLGTPISSIMGWVEYMRSSIGSGDHFNMGETQQILNNMDSDLQRLTKITARFSQIGSFPTMVPCDLREILTDVSSYFQLRLPLLLKRISIEYDFNQMPLVNANRELLEWVFENLLKNAIDAINKNDGIIRIKTEHIRPDNIIRIQISDNGKGISWESQKKVFSPGFTTKRRGWGLGLTLAKRIIEDYHKGEIYIRWSQKEKGTMFYVDLPVSNRSSGNDITPGKEGTAT
jgi:signal transduction histidine kinase